MVESLSPLDLRDDEPLELPLPLPTFRPRALVLPLPPLPVVPLPLFPLPLPVLPLPVARGALPRDGLGGTAGAVVVVSSG